MRSSLSKAIITFVALVAYSLPGFIHADTLSISPASGTYGSGKTISARIFLSTPNQAVNAISAVVGFPTDKLQVLSISRVGSIVTLWVQEPTYSNADGTISFEGVIPNPGYTGYNGDLVTVTFRVVGQGSAQVKFNSGAVLANDGNGTNILKNLNTATYNLGGEPIAPVAASPVDEAPSGSLAPKAPVVVSSSYPDSKKWYTEKIGRFAWKVPEDVTAVRVLLGRMPKSEPTVVYTDPIDSKEIPDIEDGVWYFHVQFRNSYGWGGIAHYLFKIDTTKPESFTIRELPRDDRTDPQPRFAFNATDAASGINRYNVQVDGGEADVWRDDGTGVYESEVLPPGKHSLVVRAYDEADNFAVASVDFEVAPIATPTIDSYTSKVSTETALSVSGTALPGVLVRLRLVKEGGEPIFIEARADSAGAYSAHYEKEIPRGTYRLAAIAIDKRGAQSEPSAEKIVISRGAWLSTVANGIIRTLAIAVPIAALAFFLIFLIFWFLHRLSKWRKSIRRELREIETTVDKAFELLKEDIEDSIHLLEHTKSRRRLTDEEGEIIMRFRKNLVDAEKVIRKEIRDVEREIGDR